MLSARDRVDRAFQHGDITEAHSVLEHLNTQRLQSRTAHQVQVADLSHERFLAAEAVLKLQPAFFSRLNATTEELRALRFDAAEVLLTGSRLFKRVDELERTLHPEGNLWLVKRLCQYGKQATSQTDPVQASQNGHQKSMDFVLPSGNIKNLSARTSTPINFDHTDGDVESANAGTSDPQQQSRNVAQNGRDVRNKNRLSVRIKVTLPYIFLALVIGIAGAYLVSRLIVETLEDRFTNQLLETGVLSADRMVVEEDRLLRSLRLLAGLQGLPEAMSANDAEQVRELVLPLVVNAGVQAVEIVDMSGQSIVSLRQRPNQGSENYGFSRGDSVFEQWDFVQQVLQGRSDHGRDKYAGVVDAPWGRYFYVAGPVFDDEHRLTGAVLIGTSLPRLVLQFRQDTLAHTSIYSVDGQIVASTLLLSDQEDVDLTIEESERILGRQDDHSMMRDLDIGSIAYREVLGPWEARGGSDIGIIGAALPRSFLISASYLTYFQIGVLVLSSLVVIITIGILVSYRITHPLMQLARASRRVARGDMRVAVAPHGNDEIADLALAFNQMVKGMRKITAYRLKELQLRNELAHERELRDLKSRFVSMVSHEFRTPLTTILSSSEYVKHYSDKAPPEKLAVHFDRIESSVQNMRQLLEDVLLIGREEMDRLDFQPQPVEFVAFCRDITGELQANTSITHQVHFSSSVHQCVICIDEMLMRLAIMNLLTNAVKYSPDESTVRFSLFVRHEIVDILVVDEGIGIPEEDQQLLFETFHRASNVGAVSGTGLGLYITKMVVDMHNGVISFESREGRGTTFHVKFPIVQPEGGNA